MSSSFPNTDQIKTAVITGVHPYDVPGFHQVFRGDSAIDVYPQNMEDFIGTPADIRAGYDALVFYNFHQETPAADSPMRAALERLGESDQGLFILHHAILAFPQWRFWSDLVGIADRGFGYHHDQTLAIHVENSDHPITQGLTGWEMPDETYTMDDAGADNNILLTTEHDPSMRTIAWTRQYKRARVFCFQSGHDNLTFVDPNFRLVVARGIQWVARRL